MKNVTISELEKPAFIGMMGGGMIGAYYGNSDAWAITGAVLGIAFQVYVYLQDKKKNESTRK